MVILGQGTFRDARATTLLDHGWSLRYVHRGFCVHLSFISWNFKSIERMGSEIVDLLYS